MTKEELKALGLHRYGPHWQGPMAADVGVHRTTVMRWYHKDRVPAYMDDKARQWGGRRSRKWAHSLKEL